MSSSTTHPPLQHSARHNTFSPNRSERTRALESMGEFASPTPHLNGIASGSNGIARSGSNGITVNLDRATSPALQNGEGSAKPEKKRKKKGWKGWAVVIEDDSGNILEINDGPEADPIQPRKGKQSRDKNIAPIPAEVEKPVVKKRKSPTPHTDEQRPRGSAPPSLPTVGSPKKFGGYWKQRTLPTVEPAPAPVPPPQPIQPERQQKRDRPQSLSATSLSPEVEENPERVPTTANRPTPRHSLPKAKPVIKKPRASAGHTRSQPTRGDTQPSTARATPVVTPDERPTKTPRNPEDLPAKVLRTARPLDQSIPMETEIRNEASLIIAQAEAHRELISDSHPVPTLSSPNDDELTPASSTRLYRPMSPSRTGQTEPIIRTAADDADADDDEDTPSEDFDATFDAEYEKVMNAYSRGIRPQNNPYAPQRYSVPVYGLEDANPPDWPEDQSPTIVTAPRRDRILPNDPVQRSHRQGYHGLTEPLAIDAHGFVENVKGNLSLILMHHLPRADAGQDAFLEQIGRELILFGHSLTSSGAGALAPRPLPPLPPPWPAFD